MSSYPWNFERVPFWVCWIFGILSVCFATTNSRLWINKQRLSGWNFPQWPFRRLNQAEYFNTHTHTRCYIRKINTFGSLLGWSGPQETMPRSVGKFPHWPFRKVKLISDSPHKLRYARTTNFSASDIWTCNIPIHPISLVLKGPFAV